MLVFYYLALYSFQHIRYFPVSHSFHQTKTPTKRERENKETALHVIPFYSGLYIVSMDCRVAHFKTSSVFLSVEHKWPRQVMLLSKNVQLYDHNLL